MYNYNDTERIRNRLELLVQDKMRHGTALNAADRSVVRELHELVQTYSDLLALIRHLGLSVVDADVSQGLRITEALLRKHHPAPPLSERN
ncbi:TPA: hypothetical protein JG904_004382 [Enterobacter hormaechei subsp. xiangfangensis]|nr:hypothetical protein [Enterobacter hormaechei subsp. xiangfangensis]